MEIRKKKKKAGLVQEKKKMLTQEMTLEASKTQWVFKTFSDLWNIVLHNYNCVLTCDAECNSLGEKRKLFHTRGPREGCGMPWYARFYTVVRSFITDTNSLLLELKNKSKCSALVEVKFCVLFQQWLRCTRSSLINNTQNAV